MHRLPTTSQTSRGKAGQTLKELAKVPKLANRKYVLEPRVVIVRSAFEAQESEAKCPTNIWRDFTTYLSEIGLLLATLAPIIYIYSYNFS